jgi:DNA polymerase III epsilon subunit-like protein
MKILIFDTETTGLPKSRIINQDTLDKWPHIVQFSFIIFDTSANAIIKSCDFIIQMQDGQKIPPESIAFHGITDAISQEKGVPLEQVLNAFFADLKTADLLVGHNVEFDINMVKVELLRMIYNHPAEICQAVKMDLHLLTNFTNIYCTMQRSIDLCAIKAKDKFGNEYNKYPRLLELHETLFQTKPKNLHNSLIDILVTLRCFMQLTCERDILTDCRNYMDISQKLGFL